MLYAFPADRTGCGFYRVIWPLSAVGDAVPHRVIYPGEDAPLRADIAGKTDSLGRSVPYVTGIEVPEDCSAVLLQRPTSVLLAQCVPYLKARNIKILVEIDDDLHALTPRHSAYRYFNAASDPSPLEPVSLDNSLDALKTCVSLADLLICSTPSLLTRYETYLDAGAQGVVLRNRLRSDWRSCLKKDFPGERTGQLPGAPRVSGLLHVPELPLPVAAEASAEFLQDLERALIAPVPTVDSDELRVGWAGVIGTHPDDLQVLGRALPRLDLASFYIVGPQPREEDEGGIDRAKRLLGNHAVSFTGSITFADFLPVLQASLDIGVAPLEDNLFNRSKSWLKPLEYMACGIPFVCSDQDEYRRLAKPLGMLAPHVIADTHKEWFRALKTLIASPALRDDLIEAGYRIADTCTYAEYAEDWQRVLAPYVEGASS